MYFPYLRGRQFELIALRELLEGKRISEKVIPIIEPVKPSSTLLKTLETFVKNDREIAVVFNPTVGDFAKKLKEMREEDSKVANELYDLLTQNDKVIKSYIMDRGILSEIKSLFIWWFKKLSLSLHQIKKETLFINRLHQIA